MADERRLSLIIVPHGDLETRTYEISYGRLKLLIALAVVLLVGLVVMVSSWWFVAAQAARVTDLEGQVAQLEEERAQVAELARNLADAEERYRQVRQLMGVQGSESPGEVALPPLRSEVADEATATTESARPSAWPLTRIGFITQRRLTTPAGVNHPGLDIAVPADSYIRAAGPGTVRDAGVDDVYGRFILIDHGDGFASMYGHASRI
ncbi:MAG: M23 family metallopeptidase, partial [Gemmatimonadota bacterium]